MGTLRWRLLALAVVLALTAACGARVSPEERAAASGGNGVEASGQGGTSEFADGSGGTGGSSGSDGGGSTSGSSGGSGGSAGAKGGSGDAKGGSGGGGGQAAAFSGDNGGSTDVGVTGTQITFGNVSTLSGPVPGLFAGAVRGTQAYFAYQNSQGGVFGRQLKLEVRDDGFDAGQNRAQTEDLTKKVFGFAGSFSLYDDAGVEAIQAAGMPDIGYGLGRDRAKSASNFSPSPSQPGWRTGPLLWYKQKFGDAVKKVGTLVGDIESARASWEGQKAAMLDLGYEIIHEGEVSPTQTDYTTDVVQMQRKGVEFVMITALDVKGLARFARAMQQQNFKPKVFATGGIGYDANLFTLAGDSVEGMYNDQQQALYLGEDSGTNPEVKLFQEWLQRTSPGAKADVFTAFGWASGRLLAEGLQKAGPKVTRASMIAALKGVTKFSANGLTAEASPGTKTPPKCWVMIRVQNGKYVRELPKNGGFDCTGEYYRIPGT